MGIFGVLGHFKVIESIIRNQPNMIFMRHILVTCSILLCCFSSQAAELRIAFSSCYEQDKYNLPIWQAIKDKQPDVFVFLGDNAYIDSDDPNKFTADYQALFANPGIQALKKDTDIMAIWDDHDYGDDDGGKHFAAKDIAKAAFVKAFNYPEINNLPKEQGIFHSRTLTLGNKKVRLIMLDTRWYRDDLLLHNLSEDDRWAFELGPYKPHTQTDKTLLGNEQWQWLEKIMAEPVDLNIIATSIQFISEYTAWEIWANFPHERQRMLDLVSKHGLGKTLFISGDVHRGETSMMEFNDTQLFDITAGPLSSLAYPAKPNVHRYGGAFIEYNFGMLTVAEVDGALSVTSGLYNTNGEVLETFKVPVQGKE